MFYGGYLMKSTVKCLSGDDLKSGVTVYWEGDSYITRKRYHSKIELFCGNVFVRTVRVKDLYMEKE
jgi:hypothetical protein